MAAAVSLSSAAAMIRSSPTPADVQRALKQLEHQLALDIKPYCSTHTAIRPIVLSVSTPLNATPYNAPTRSAEERTTIPDESNLKWVLVPSERVSLHTGERAHTLWFFVSLFSTIDFTVRHCHVISYRFLHYFNSTWFKADSTGRKGSWMIPLVYCRRIEMLDPSRQQLLPAFTLYSRPVRPRLFSVAKHRSTYQEAFDTRLYLYNWKNSSLEYQRNHPLSLSQWKYAGIDAKENIIDAKKWDHLIFSLIAAFVPEVPNAKIPWICFEAALLELKIQLYPELEGFLARRCRWIYDDLPEATSSHVQRASECRVSPTLDTRKWMSKIDPEVKQMAIRFLQSIEEMQQKRDVDMHYQQKRDELLRWYRYIPPPLSAEEEIRQAKISELSSKIQELLRTAPEDTKRLLRSVLYGTVRENAQLSSSQRDEVNQYLVDAGLDLKTTWILVRPASVWEYEKENPLVKATEIVTAARKAYAKHAAAALPVSTRTPKGMEQNAILQESEVPNAVDGIALTFSSESVRGDTSDRTESPAKRRKLQHAGRL
jgi:hypothetical protein